MPMDKVTSLPLATYFRPQKLVDFVGHERILNETGFLYSAIKNDRVPSLIFWGPPGTGKTTLALIIAQETQADFLQLSAVNSGVKDLRQIVERAEANSRMKIKTILFVDEIHRWNKAQQDALLPEVENGRLILIGATTENPSFALNSALLSRAKVVVLDSLSPDNLAVIINNAAKKLKVKLKADIVSVIARYADGDARVALNILEAARHQSSSPDLKIIKEIINKPNLLYDKTGEQHYNLISALHKSMRGSDVNAALYWLARMLAGGEDPLYIARRIIRFASEDIGLANSRALEQAVAAFNACSFLGMPECNVILAQVVVYMAKCKKSNGLYCAYNQAAADVAEYGNLPVPLHIRNAPTKLMKDLNYGKDYKYSPDYNYKEKQEYLPKELQGRKYLK